MSNKLVIYIFQLCLNRLRASGEDVRIVYNNPEGTITFQGSLKFMEKLPLPKVGAR